MEKIYRVNDYEFSIDKEDGTLVIRSGMESTAIQFEEATEMIGELSRDLAMVAAIKEEESMGMFEKFWKNLGK